MRILGAIIAAIPIVTMIRIFNKKEVLAPSNLYSVLYLITILIPTLIYAGNDSIAQLSNKYLRDAVSDDSIYLQYTILQTISYYLVLLGIGLRFRQRTLVYVFPSSYSHDEETENYNFNDTINHKYKFWGLLFTIIGFGIFYIIMQKVGGAYYFFSHLQYRLSLTRDVDLLSWLLPLLHYGPLVLVYSLRETRKKMSIWMLLLIIVSGFCCGLGGRKAVILMLFEAITIYHYSVKSISIKNIFKPKYVILIVVIAVFFITYVQFRQEGAFESFLSNPYTFIKDNSSGISKVFTSESYVSFYMAIIKYFRNHSYWRGSSYLGLLTAIIPSSLFAGKPPVDDGMYLYSICQGRTDIFPVMKTSALNGSSYPLETFGSAYANFGIIGLFLAMIFLGVIINYFYRKLKKSNYSLFSIIIYAQVIFGFEFSTLRIFQLFQTIVIVWMMTRYIEVFKIKKSK